MGVALNDVAKAFGYAIVVFVAFFKFPVNTAILCAVEATSSRAVGNPFVPSESSFIACELSSAESKSVIGRNEPEK